VFASEQDRPDIARRRAWWKKYQARIDPRRLVFIDETWAKTNMARSHGWNRRGEPLNAKVPHGHWTTMTFLAALRHDRIAAPCVFDGPINGQSFLAYVRQFLIPTLKPGGTVVMDNLGSHKGRAVRAALRQALLPPALQSRSQLHRTGLRQAQDAVAQGRGTIRRSNLATHRLRPPMLHFQRMRRPHR
jgi:hypothetical protein